MGRNGWGRVRTEFEIVRGEHRPSTISNSVWIRLVNFASLVTRSKNENQRVVKVCEKWTGSRDTAGAEAISIWPGGVPLFPVLSLLFLDPTSRDRSETWRVESNRDFTTVGGGSNPFQPGCVGVSAAHVTTDRKQCDPGHAMGWGFGNRRNLRFYDDWSHNRTDSDAGRACATVR